VRENRSIQRLFLDSMVESVGVEVAGIERVQLIRDLVMRPGVRSILKT
jgi:hypothetical protein